MTTSVSFYVVAHADDWQLFMSPHATRDLAEAAAATRRTVFVHLTTGDDGFDRAFWIGREIGAVNSIRYGLGLLPDLEPVVEWTTHADHAVARYRVGNATAYFLRLPDGNMAGEGYVVTRHQSLQALVAGNGPMTTLADPALGDQAASYESARDVSATVRAILDHELGSSAEAPVHCLDGSVPDHPPDGHAEHADHIAVGTIVADAIGHDDRYSIRTFLDYDARLHPPNVDGDDLRLKIGMFLAYNFFARVASGDTYPVTAVMPEYQAWLEREIRTN